MPLDTSASEVDTVFSCVSIFQLISSLPTYPPREHNLTYTYLHLFHPDVFINVHISNGQIDGKQLIVYCRVSISQLISLFEYCVCNMKNIS